MIQLILKKSGADNNPMVFLFNDTQLKMEQFLEDINNILNTGEVGTIIYHHPQSTIHQPLVTVSDQVWFCHRKIIQLESHRS